MYTVFDVILDVQRCLINFEPLRPWKPLLFERLQSTPLKGHHNLQLTVSRIHVKEKQLYKHNVIPWSIKWPIEEAQAITNVLLEKQRKYLQQIKKNRYHRNIATDLLTKLFVDMCSDSFDVTFSNDYKVDMAYTVCQYAIVEFQEMIHAESDPM